MKRASLVCAVPCAVGRRACSAADAAGAAPKALVSGLDLAVVRQGRAAAGRSVPARQRRLAGQDRDSRRQGLVRRVRHAVRQGPGRPASHRRRGREVDDQGRRDPKRRRSATSTRASWTRRAPKQLGITPLEPELAAIDAIKTKTDLARHFAQLLQAESDQPDRRATSTATRSSRRTTILYVFQGGLGLPDRDYYLKNDAKLKEYREKYVGFVGNDPRARPATPTPSKSAREIFVARDAAGPRALDQRREPRRGEDLQQGHASPIWRSSSPASTGTRGRRSSASTACPRSWSANRAT